MRKTKKRTPVRTRKQLALRRLTILLILLVVVSWLFPILNLTPRQAVWRYEERAGLRDTSVVMRQLQKGHPRMLTAYLTANEDGMMLGLTRLTVFGWEPLVGAALPCEGIEPAYVQQHMISYQDRQSRSEYYFFGRVDDPAVESLEISMRRVSVWGKDGRPAEWEELASLFDAENIWYEKGGKRYFLMNMKPELEGKPNVESFLLGYDRNGELLHEIPIQRKSGTGISS